MSKATFCASLLKGDNRQRCISALKQIPEGKSSRKTRSAVLVPLLELDDEVNLLYTVRSNNLRHHRGEVSFPGGKADDGDLDATDTALRESEEELGIWRQNVDVWGALPSMPNRQGTMLITPVVGVLQGYDREKLQINKSEVSHVFERSVSSLAESVHYTTFTTGKGYTIPVYPWDEGDRLWGISAIITHVTLCLLAPQLYRYPQHLNHLTALADWEKPNS